MDEALHLAGGLASYRWGSLLLETAQVVPAKGRTIFELLSHFEVGRFPAQNDTELRTSIAALHELVHMQQDIATGLGAWDHVSTRYSYERLWHYGHHFAKPDGSPPYADAWKELDSSTAPEDARIQVQRAFHEIQIFTVGQRQLAGQKWSNFSAVDFLEKQIGRRLTEAEKSSFSLKELMEADAACEVYNAVRRSQFPENSSELVYDNADKWYIPLMPTEYQRPVIAFLDMMRGDIELTAENAETALGNASRLFPWIVDMAFAYPTPKVMREWEGHQGAFDPVARYILILASLEAMENDVFSEWATLVASGSWIDAEEIFLSHSNLPYPPTRECYEQWATELDGLVNEGDWDAPLFEVRRNAIKARLEGYLPRGPRSFLEAKTPLHILVQGIGMRSLHHGQHLWEPEIIMRPLLAHLSHMRMFDLLTEHRSFRCPFGQATGVCPAVEQKCLDGISDLRTLPPATDCRVRYTLLDAGWNM